jgi:hypothetical protein
MKVLLFGLAWTACFTVQAQYAVTSPPAGATNLQKSKNQQTAGWILLTGGALMVLIGSIAAANEAGNELVNLFNANATPNKNAGKGATVVAMTGLLSMAGSIPLFLASGKNRRKAAAAISFKVESETQIRYMAFSNLRYPALQLQVAL